MSIGLAVHATVRLPDFALDAAFRVPPGLTVLFGPSGAGKSLTLQAIAGLVPLDAGRIALGQRALADSAQGTMLPPRLRRLGYVPQQYALFPHLTVAQNVAYALPRPRHPWDHVTKAVRDEQVAALLELVRLPGYAGRWPRQLSGGQAQRVALARALAADPAALLLDEPLSALDAPTRLAVRDDLRAIVLAGGLPSLVVTHDLAEARALADRLVVLIAGRVVTEGPVDAVLAAPPSAECARLLGWRNVLPVARLERAGATMRVTLTCGQTLALANEGHGVSTADQVALALHADRLEFAPGGGAEYTGSGACLDGTVLAAHDAGPYYAVTVGLGAGDSDTADLDVTCSPREWAALGCAAGQSVRVRVPPGAARLVTNGARASQGELAGGT
ncbi:MAG TPA: ABC transporter ATP-binding protein [Ktedonobacterales bacterium]